jgi:hypothetical protein
MEMSRVVHVLAINRCEESPRCQDLAVVINRHTTIACSEDSYNVSLGEEPVTNSSEPLIQITAEPNGRPIGVHNTDK